MWSWRSWLLGVVALTSSAVARSATGDRVLVVLEKQVVKEDYSKFWASLQERGFDLTFKTPRDDSASLTRYGEPQYDHLIMFTPSTKSYSAGLAPKEVVSAQFQGLNTLYLLSPNISELNRDTFREYDLEFVERDFLYLDAFSHVSSAPLSTALLPSTSCLVPNGPILSPSTLTGGPVVFPSGTVHSIGMNPYLIDIAHGSKTGYVGEDRPADDDEAEVEGMLGRSKEVVVSGEKAALVSAMQTRDNTRIGFVGSGAMFSDEWWGASVKDTTGKTVHTGNPGFAEDLTKWLFQETGVVRVISTTHHKKDDSQPRELYRIKDDLTYSVSLAQHDSNQNSSSWAAFNVEDLQLDFTMLDPHVRTSMIRQNAESTSTQTTYAASFKAPDRHGVFKFVIEYWRPGWSYVRTSSTASVTPFRHDEYPRFILGAWPFYSSAISMSIAFLLFCGLWVALEDGDRKGKKKAE